MSQQSRSTIKSYFQTGDIPTQQEYVHLIDSFVALTNDTNSGSIELTGSLNVSGTLTGTTATITSADLTDLTVSGTGSFSKITVGTDATENSEATGQTTDPVEVSVMGDISASGIVYGRRMVTNQFDIGVLNSDNPLLKIFAGISSSEAVIDDGDPAIFSEKGISFTLNSSGDDETDGSSISGSVGSTFKIFQTDPGQTSGLAGVLSKKVFEIDYSGSIGQVNNITASGNISCSGTVIADNFTSTGGDDQITFTDDLYVNGNITASGNISGSNDIKGKFITASNTLYLGNTNTSISDVSYGKIVAGTILSDTPINVFQTTANGQLIFGQYENANHMQISCSMFRVKAKGDVTFDINGEDFKLHKSDGSGNDTAYFNFNLTSPNPQLDVDGTTFNIVPTGGNTFFDSNITSSGNISSSGDILASRYKTDGYISLNTDGTTQGRVFGDTNITSIQIGRDGTSNKNIELLGPVTASGDISSSGTVTGNNGSFNDITYGGTDLSVSATELNSWENLTSAEASQVKNIGNATIDATQWSYVGEMDQRITQASTVNFAGVTLDKTTSVSANYVLGEVEMSAPAHNFVLTLTNAPSLAPDEASDLFEVKQNNRVVATSTIIGTVFEEALVVQCSAVVDGGFRFNLVNRRSAYGGGSIKINFIVL